jgi:CheY-like chemotaxis protein
MDNARILVVEDEPLIGAELEECIEDLGYEVPRVIDSVDDIFPAYRECEPDLVLMDIKLKSFNDGIDAARRLRIISDVPIIFLTAFTDRDTRARAEAVCPAAFLGKPLDEKLLAEEIRRALEVPRGSPYCPDRN